MILKRKTLTLTKHKKTFFFLRRVENIKASIFKAKGSIVIAEMLRIKYFLLWENEHNPIPHYLNRFMFIFHI